VPEGALGSWWEGLHFYFNIQPSFPKKKHDDVGFLNQILEALSFEL